MKLTRRDKRVLAAGFLIALGIVAWSFGLSPMQRRWKKARIALQADRDQLAKLQRVAGEREQYARERGRIARLVRQTPDLLASQRVIPVLINDVQGLSQEAGIKITRYEPLPPKVAENYAAYSLTLAGQAGLARLVGFLYDLQSHRPVIAVTRLHIIPPSAEATTEDVSFELMISTYAIQEMDRIKKPDTTASAGDGTTG